MLKVLAAYTDSYRAIEGTISYDGMSPEELRKHHKAEAAYLPEDDKVSRVRSSDRRKRQRNTPFLRYRMSLRSRTCELTVPNYTQHLAHLTVGETLTFASAARTPSAAARVGSRQEAIDNKRDVLLTLFGLKHTYNTKVGDDVVRGVSGGERKRVSIAELLTTGAKIGCHDNSTRGLDASTAVEYCKALRIATDLGQLTTCLSIYQAGEQL